MKSQIIALPNGMIGSTFFTSISQNDKGVVNISGIEEELERVLQNHKMDDDTVYPAIYGDAIYELSTVIVKRGENDDGDFAERMAAARMDIEHIFGSTGSLFKRLSQKHTWKIAQMGCHVREHLFSILFMLDLYINMNGSKFATKYKLKRPDVEEYLNVDNDDYYDGEDADEYILELLVESNDNN
jgi:hypothetical protein